MFAFLLGILATVLFYNRSTILASAFFNKSEQLFPFLVALTWFFCALLFTKGNYHMPWDTVEYFAKASNLVFHGEYLDGDGRSYDNHLGMVYLVSIFLYLFGDNLQLWTLLLGISAATVPVLIMVLGRIWFNTTIFYQAP